MFGYVQPLKPELKVKEFSLYRGYYCGVCKALGMLYGQPSRFTVTYDAAFLAFINSALTEDEENISLERCAVNPLRPKPIVSFDPAVNYAAAVNLIMAYYKLKDSWHDEKNSFSLLASWVLRPSAMRMKKAYPEIGDAVAKQLGRLAILEAEKATSIDEVSHPFAKLISAVLPAPHVKGRQRRVMEWLGYNLGKWVYIVDAYSDIESDIASGSYNVLIAKYEKDASPLFPSSITAVHVNRQQREKVDTSISSIREKSKAEVEFILNACLAEIGKAFELLDIKKNGALLENIIYLGLPYKTQMMLNGRGESDGSIQGFGRKARCNAGGDKGGL